MMRAFLCACVLSIASQATAAQSDKTPIPAFDAAQDLAARNAIADQLTVVMKIDKQFAAVMPQIVDMLLPTFIKDNGDKADQIRAIVGEEMNLAYASRNGEFVRLTRDVYARNFTTAQLKDLVTFYSSETGQAFIEKMPAITQQSMQAGALIGERAARDAIPRIMSRMQAAQLAVPKGS